MVETSPSGAKTFDVAVIGAGLNGAAAALVFARAGFTVASLGGRERVGRGRTVALFGRSLALIDDLGLLEALQTLGAPLRALRLVDDTGSLFAPAPVEFRCREIGLDAFGWNIENDTLADILAEAVTTEPTIMRRERHVVSLNWNPDAVQLIDDGGATLEAKLVVAADGRDSPTRKAAGIVTRKTPYAQAALTLFLAHSRPHDDFSSEFHTREGPFTLVPLPPTAEAPHRSSLVWLMSTASAERRRSLDDCELAREIERQAHGLLGALSIEGEHGIFPMMRLRATRLVATRIGLVGDAAHVYPPIGAQGLNLGLRDVDDLARAALSAREHGADIGGPAALAAYERSRALDIAERMIAVNGLNLSLLTPLAPVDAMRGLGLAALSRIGPLRRFVMREGLSPQWVR